ncbi:MAG TPA: XrtA system polysaccharide chain length determinant [Rhodocyclaceae bacterium]|nr:XrtA system polysaccharide chain length determinant [Rhodocyclaceae bacterium]
MNDKLLLKLMLNLRAIWKYRWRGVYVAFGVAVLCAIIVFAIPSKYEASARIYADTDSILKPLMAGMTVQPDINQRVAMLSRVVISRPNVEQLIHVTGLDEDAKTPAERERLIDQVMDVLELQKPTGERNANIYVVKFRDVKQQRAKHVVEVLVSMFIDTSKGGGESDAAAAKTFLGEQASAYEKKLRDAENKLKEFKLKNMDTATANDGKDYFAQMALAEQQLHEAQLQLREAENSRDAFRRGLAGEDLANGPPGSASSGGAGEGISDIDARLDAMKRNLDSLLQRYTEDHPDVVGARRVIRELEDQRRRLVDHYRKAGVPLIQAATTGPRASEQLKVSLAQAEASVASLRARVGEYSGRYQKLREMARQAPQYEAELAQLNRDYEVNKKNYESLIARRESANISGDMQSVAGVADFRLVDPPRVSPQPVFPNRLLLLSLSLLLALGAGMGVMVASDRLRPCFYERSQLREVTGLPILGVVSLAVNDQMRVAQKQDLTRMAKMAGAMSAGYLVIVVAGHLLTRTVG